MIQENPFTDNFKTAKNVNKWSNYTLYLSALLITISFLAKTFHIQSCILVNYIPNINCILIALYAMQKIAIEYFGFEACIHKRRDFIDNSFHSTLSEARTLEYFSNSNINPGIYKMAINGFENSLFTYNISKEMLFLVWIKTLFFGILFLSFGLFGYENVLILIFQISLPLILLQNAIKHSLFVSRSKTIFNDYRKLFYDFKMDIDKTKKYPEILTILLDYETAISAANILLSDKVYNKLNRNLSDLWEKMKIEYNISS